MITLYESILRSTKSGKDVFKPKYISGWTGQQIWQVDSDMKKWFENCDKIEKPFVFNITDSFATGTLGREELFKNGFKKLTIASKNDGYKPNSVISFTDSKLSLKYLQKAQFDGEFETLNLRATPVGSSLTRHIKHRVKILNQTKLNDSEVTNLLKTLIPNVVDHFKIIIIDEFYFKKSKGRYHEWSIL